MIIVKVSGGVGNQLFQYAFGRHIALTNNTELWIDAQFYESKQFNTARRFELSRFNICYERIFYGIKPYESAIGSLSAELKYVKESDYGVLPERWKEIGRLGNNLVLDG